MKVRKKVHFKFDILVLLLVFTIFHSSFPLAANDNPGATPGTKAASSLTNIEKKIVELMKKGDIPGLSLVIVNGDQPVYMKGFGYADIEKKIPVTDDTLFELGSTSKAFTALAALQLEKEGSINLDDPVSKYLDWFSATYKGKKYEITLRQVLHQTSGIPFKSIALIPESNAADALQKTVRNLKGIKLARVPGEVFEYATINYDIIGAVIEKVTRMSYEEYIAKRVLQPLELTHTRVGADKSDPLMAKGYKVSFFTPRPYDAPVYRGNNPAGYIVSNAKDMTRWLQFQMGLLEPGGGMGELMRKSHQPDKSVNPMPGTLVAYGMGWMVHEYGIRLIEHSGQNPNFTSYVAFRPGEKIGVVVLTNAMNNYTTHIGDVVMELTRGKQIPAEMVEGRTIDGVASIFSFGLGLYLLLVLVYIVTVFIDLFRGRRQFESITLKKTAKLIGMALAYLPFAAGVYLLPLAMSGLPWKVASVWSPSSFPTTAILVVAVMCVSYIASILSLFFPVKNKYIRNLPLIIILSLLSGAANAVVIFLITTSLFTNIELKYQVYFYALAFMIYIVGRKVIQTRLTIITFEIVYDLRMRLIDKIFLTTYQNFEKLDRGRVFATLNDDTGQIANSAGLVVGLITSVITAICAFVYLATIAFWATAVTLAVVFIIAGLYGFVSGKARQYFEEARDTRNVYMGLLNGLLDGFKELSLRLNKKRQYRGDVEKTSMEFQNKMAMAIIRFINAFLIGESMLLIVLGAVSFAIPRIFPNISQFTLMSFIMILLYLIGPVNVILNSIPAIVQIRVAWNRVKEFERDVPANIDPQKLIASEATKGEVERITAKDVEFRYESQDKEETFIVGPLDFEARKGEITFIIGGNGSGKTTLAKLLTGLYLPGKGQVQIEGRNLGDQEVGEYCSTVFSGYHLFEKLYDVDLTKVGKKEQADKYLKLLNLDDKVQIGDTGFSTIDLSGGQKKRLALLQCYLEDAPIYLFDEVAADQDPEFRKFFYRTLLQKMKEEGKIVIAITHDDHYFDVADKIIKMDMGQIEAVDASYRTTAAE
ncbi:MAG: cyclic peptide export ABC transporter [Candidatus Aminicenantes bacterium]|nr:cyclic peptide export ABC transporter [Candidatus Aminicenantes bacterium]